MAEQDHSLIARPKRPEMGTVWKDAYTTEKFQDGELNDLVRADMLGIGVSIPASWYIDIIAVLRIGALNAVIPPTVLDFRREIEELCIELYGVEDFNFRMVETFNRINRIKR